MTRLASSGRAIAAATMALAVISMVPAAGTASSLDDLISSLKKNAGEIVDLVSDAAVETAAKVAVIAGLDIACDALGDLPAFVRDACDSVVGRDAVQADVDALIDALTSRPDLDALAASLASLPDESDADGRAMALADLYARLSSDTDFLFERLDELDAIIADRALVLDSVRVLDATGAREALPAEIRAALDALPLDELETDLATWQLIRDVAASTLSDLEDLRLLIDEERIALGGAPRDEVVGGSPASFPPAWLDGNGGPAVEFRFGTPATLGEPAFRFTRPAGAYEEECWTVEEDVGLHICFRRPHGWVSVYLDSANGYLWYDLTYQRTCELLVPNGAGDGFTSGIYRKATAGEPASADAALTCDDHPQADQLTTFTLLGHEWSAPITGVAAPPDDD